MDKIPRTKRINKRNRFRSLLFLVLVFGFWFWFLVFGFGFWFLVFGFGFWFWFLVLVFVF